MSRGGGDNNTRGYVCTGYLILGDGEWWVDVAETGFRAQIWPRVEWVFAMNYAGVVS